MVAWFSKFESVFNNGNLKQTLKTAGPEQDYSSNLLICSPIIGVTMYHFDVIGLFIRAK